MHTECLAERSGKRDTEGGNPFGVAGSTVEELGEDTRFLRNTLTGKIASGVGSRINLRQGSRTSSAGTCSQRIGLTTINAARPSNARSTLAPEFRPHDLQHVTYVAGCHWGLRYGMVWCGMVEVCGGWLAGHRESVQVRLRIGTMLTSVGRHCGQVTTFALLLQ